MGRPRRRTEQARLLGRAGAPAIGVRIAIDETGEVLAQSNHNLDAYWQNPEATAEAQRGNWFHTGDGGTFDDGYLTIADRKKDVIITGGENVSSIEVEDVLNSHPAVREVAVIGIPDDKWGELVTALVVDRRTPADRGRPHRPLPHAAGGLQVPEEGASSSTALPAPPPASCRSSSCGSRSGRAWNRQRELSLRLSRPAAPA